MSLNIKNEDVHAAVRELADALGISQTSAVEVAVRDKLDAVRAERRRVERERRIRQAVAELQAAVADDGAAIDLWAYADGLYDRDTGLPR